MNKRLILLMLGCLALAFIILFTLLSLTELPNSKNNGFKRKWLSANVEEPINQNIISPLVIRISGGTNNHIFFSGNDPRWVIMTNLSLQPIDTMLYATNLHEKLRTPNITVDSPHIYMYAGEIPCLLDGQVEQVQIDTTPLKTNLITRFAQISNHQLIIRGIDSTQSRQVFKLMDSKTGDVIKEIDLIKKQQFGGFDTDGFLQYDKNSNRVFYLQMFQNTIYCLDTSLNVLYTANTIDTTRTNQVAINLVNNGNETKVMSTKARQYVNEELSSGNGYLFVISGLRADNETIPEFNKNSTIDLYNTANGNYFGSFRIPKLDGKKAKRLLILPHQMVALYTDGLAATFNLPREVISSN